MSISMFPMITRKALASIGNGLSFCAKAVDIRDIFVFGGLALMGYGLSEFLPWVGMSVSGAVLIALGLGWLTRRPGN